MSQNELDQLVDQLYVDDARVRRNAVQRLGESGQPEYIAELVNVYMKDSDAGVRKAAENALRTFRRIEENMLHGEGEEQPVQQDLTPILSRARLGLAIVLVMTFFINGVILIGRALPQPSITTPTPSGPTQRSILVTSFDKRISRAHDDAITLRKLFSSIQGGMGLQGVNKDQCQTLQAEPLDTVDIAQIDSVTYPDLKSVNDLINLAAPRIGVIRNEYMKLCAAQTQQDFDGQVSALGGAGKVVADLDDASNKSLADASLALKKAIDSPAPTVGPTFTPTSTFTPTVPSATPTPTPTITPIPSSTNVAGEGTTAVATGGAVPPSVSGPYTFTGLQLSNFTSYKYRVNASTSGTLTSNKVFSGSLQVSASRQAAPAQAEYDINVNEGLANITFFKPILGGLYIPGGASTYIVIQNALYESGVVLTSAKFSGRCRVTKIPGSNAMPAKVQDLALSDLNGLSLQQEAGETVVNGFKAVHYKGQRTIGDNNEYKQTLDLFVSSDKGVPVNLTENVTLDPKVKSNSGLKNYTFILTYDLLATQVALDISKPISCG